MLRLLLGLYYYLLSKWFKIVEVFLLIIAFWCNYVEDIIIMLVRNLLAFARGIIIVTGIHSR